MTLNIPLCVPCLNGNEKKYLIECVETNFVSSVGPFVKKFEEELQRLNGFQEQPVAFNTGTAALHIGFLSLGIEPGDLVIMPSYTFIATANAASYCGAIPWLMDINESSLTLDADLVEKEIQENTKLLNGELYHVSLNRRVKAIVPVYLNGTPADMDRLVAIAKKYSLKLFVDAAAALGCTYKQKILSQHGADLYALSFNGNKTFTAGGGGALLSNDSSLLDKARHLSTTARIGSEYDYDQIGYNYRLTNIQAAVGYAQLENYSFFLKRKREIFDTYIKELSTHSCIKPFPIPSWVESSCWMANFILNDRLKKEELINYLQNKGIQARSFWKPLHLQLPYKNSLKSHMKVAEKIWECVISFPCSVELDNKNSYEIINIIKQKLETFS